MKNLIKSVKAQLLDAGCYKLRLYVFTFILAKASLLQVEGKVHSVLARLSPKREEKKHQRWFFLCSVSFFWAKKVGVKLTESGGETRLLQGSFHLLQ